MLKRRLLAVVTGIALMMAVAGLSGIVADELGYSVTSPAQACQDSSAGGGC